MLPVEHGVATTLGALVSPGCCLQAGRVAGIPTAAGAGGVEVSKI